MTLPIIFLRVVSANDFSKKTCSVLEQCVLLLPVNLLHTEIGLGSQQSTMLRTPRRQAQPGAPCTSQKKEGNGKQNGFVPASLYVTASKNGVHTVPQHTPTLSSAARTAVRHIFKDAHVVAHGLSSHNEQHADLEQG